MNKQVESKLKTNNKAIWNSYAKNCISTEVDTFNKLLIITRNNVVDSGEVKIIYKYDDFYKLKFHRYEQE